MSLLLSKLIISPLLLLAASLASRKWGHAIGGILAGLPLTSAPISVFLAIEFGPEFAANAAQGTLIAACAQAAIAVTYYALAKRGILVALSAATAAFILVALLAQALTLTLGQTLLAAAAMGTLAIVLVPRRQYAHKVVPVSRWDIPARMMLIVLLVIVVSAIAPRIGAAASGILAAFPFMVIILTVFAHRFVGPESARMVMRGLALSLPSFTLFFAVVSYGLPQFSLLITYSTAVIVGALTQLTTLWIARKF